MHIYIKINNNNYLITKKIVNFAAPGPQLRQYPVPRPSVVAPSRHQMHQIVNASPGPSNGHALPQHGQLYRNSVGSNSVQHDNYALPPNPALARQYGK